VLDQLHSPIQGLLPHGLGAFLPGTALAMASAVLFGVGAVLQHHAASATTAGGGLRLREMARHPSWLVGQLSTAAGSGLQVAALALAPVAIVQPLLAASLVVALALRSIRSHCWPTGPELLGAVLTAGGLAVFLIAARPAPGTPGRLPDLLAVIGATVLGLAVVAAATRLRRGASGALICGIAAGLAAGIAAVLISSALRILTDHGLVRALTRPELWAAIVMAVAAQVGAQQAFSRGALTWSLPALIVLDPLAAVPAARFLLGERLEPGHAAVWLPAAVVAAVGVVLLARSAEHCRRPIRVGRRRRSAVVTSADPAPTPG
jgi:hypothetical protein